VLTTGCPQHRSAGFTLIELLITMSLLVVLLRLAAPSFATWIHNAQVRTVAESLDNALRQAQNESVRRSRQVVFSLTNDTPGIGSAAAANGNHWALHAVPLPTEALQFISGGVLGDADNVTITGPGALCFNSMGRQVANASPGVADAVCTISAADPLTSYDVAVSGADRPLRVTVSLGGQVRMCDPSHTLSSSYPEGCP